MGLVDKLLQVGRTARARSSVVESGPSAIHARGLFARQRMAAGQRIGTLELGPAQAQGRHTLLVGDEHRLVAEPWRYINHACTPTAVLRVTDRDAVLIAACEVAPGEEITIDYMALPEKVGTPFECRCTRCAAAAVSSRVGE